MNNKYSNKYGYNQKRPKERKTNNNIEHQKSKKTSSIGGIGLIGANYKRQSASSSTNTNIDEGTNGNLNSESTLENAYETDKTAKVTIKIAKLSTPIIIVIIAVSSFVLLLGFISVILPSAGIFDDDTVTQSEHLEYLAKINSDCKSLTVEGNSISLDDYVAKVVASEIGNNAPYEAKKALAIVARTYVIKNTNSCKQAVPATDETFQTYNNSITPDESTVKAVQETRSQIIFENNILINAKHDNYCTVEELRNDGTGGFTCDGSMCHVIYAKIGSGNQTSWEKHTVEIPLSYKEQLTGGDCYGMSEVAAVYMANNGSNYETILKEFYSTNITVESFTQADGLELTDIPNYLARTSRANRTNSYYYNTSSGLSANGLEGECAWYGLCRAQEILATSGSSKKFSRGGNGGQFCEVAESLPDNFPIVRDYTKPKAGSLVVWKGGSSGYGHVAVIEKVIDEDTVFLSEAGIGTGQFGRTATDLLWTNGSLYSAAITKYGSNALARKANCEGNDTGCQSFKKVSISRIKNYGGMNFACYVYLLDE